MSNYIIKKENTHLLTQAYRSHVYVLYRCGFFRDKEIFRSFDLKEVEKYKEDLIG